MDFSWSGDSQLPVASRQPPVATHKMRLSKIILPKLLPEAFLFFQKESLI
jgi:hypothetical protein